VRNAADFKPNKVPLLLQIFLKPQKRYFSLDEILTIQLAKLKEGSM
jgi:hypothetical protein